MLMFKKSILIGLRLLLGSLTLVAIVLQAAHTHRAGAFNPANYLSYFTNLSNIFAAVVLIMSALYLMKSRKPSRRDDIIRGAATLYMAVTGAVYVTLLSGEELGLLMPWVNVLTHMVMPVFVIADWLYQPPQTKLRFKHIWLWFIFPLAYVVYSLIRGAAVGWYAYPFLNPDKVGGYGSVSLYCVGILVVFFGFAWALMGLGNKLKRHV